MTSKFAASSRALRKSTRWVGEYIWSETGDLDRIPVSPVERLRSRSPLLGRIGFSMQDASRYLGITDGFRAVHDTHSVVEDRSWYPKQE